VSFDFVCVGDGQAELANYSAIPEGGAALQFISLNGSATIQRVLPGGVPVTWNVQSVNASDEIELIGPSSTPPCTVSPGPTPTQAPAPSATSAPTAVEARTIRDTCAD
jgi:hypothetical protein